MAALDLTASSEPFLVDPRYEFDAPQYWDLSKVSQGLEGPEDRVDLWFDGGIHGAVFRSPCLVTHSSLSLEATISVS